MSLHQCVLYLIDFLGLSPVVAVGLIVIVFRMKTPIYKSKVTLFHYEFKCSPQDMILDLDTIPTE